VSQKKQGTTLLSITCQLLSTFGEVMDNIVVPCFFDSQCSSTFFRTRCISVWLHFLFKWIWIIFGVTSVAHGELGE